MWFFTDNTISPVLSCVYPDWLAGKDWVDASANYRLSVHKHKRHLVLHNDIRGTTPSRLTCLDFVLPEMGESYFSGYFYVDSWWVVTLAIIIVTLKFRSFFKPLLIRQKPETFIYADNSTLTH